MKIRIGHGFDVHRFGPGDAVVIGGVRIKHDAGILAHSDGDVAIHALCDALLGASALGDIGKHFPDSDPAYADAASTTLLAHVRALLEREGYRVSNADITVVAEAPRLAPHIASMRANIADVLGVSADAVSVKATTTEGLGLVGRREGLAAHAVAVIESSD